MSHMYQVIIKIGFFCGGLLYKCIVKYLTSSQSSRNEIQEALGQGIQNVPRNPGVPCHLEILTKKMSSKTLHYVRYQLPNK